MSGERTAPDRDLEAFVEAIEAAMRARRGRDHALSPRDFALVRGWHEAGVSLATVLVAIDAAFARDPDTSSLALVRRRVEELAGETRRGGAVADASRPSLPEVAERLDALRDRLLGLPGRFAALPLAEVAELSDLVAVASRPNWDYLRERLQRVDALVAEAAIEALGTDEAAALRAEAERAAGRLRGRVDAATLVEATDRLLRVRARERLGLPRVGIG